MVKGKLGWLQAIRMPRFFYGWWIVVACLVVGVFAIGAPYYAFSVFLKPLAEAFGWDRATVSAALIFYFIPHGIAGIFAGRLAQRFGAPWMITLGAVGLGASLFLLSSVHKLWEFYAWYTLFGIGMAFTGLVPLGLVITNWFTKKRGIAMGIMQIGFSLGALVGGPFIEYIIEGFNWRVAYIALGLLVILITIPVALKVIRTRPEEMGLFPNGEKPMPVQATSTAVRGEAIVGSLATLKEKTLGAWLVSLPLWLISIGFFLTDMSRIAVVTHQVALLTDVGIPAMIAATALGFTGVIGGLGKLSSGYLADRLPLRYVTILCFILQGLGIFLLTKISSVFMLWVYVVIFGFASGASPTLMPLVVGKVFPVRHFGTLYGFVHFLTMIAFAVGPVYAGYVYDVALSYSWAINVFLIAYIVAIAAIYLAWGVKPKSPS